MSSTTEGAWSANIEGLMRSVKAGRIVHAVLFTGPRGTGKRTAARWLARALVCTGDEPPCGACPECKQFLAGNHPDVHVISQGARSISVNDIRALREELTLRPFEGGRHVVIIEKAERMTDQAQNALLKTLEEPIGEVVFFVITDQPGSMLPTIVSRCRRVRFSPLDIDRCARVLTERGVSPERARALAAAAQGSVGRAEELGADETYFPLREDVLASLKQLEMGRGAVARAAARLEGKKDVSRQVLEIMEVIARDLMAVQNGARPYGDIPASDAPGGVGGFLAIDGRSLLMAVMEMRRMLSSNVAWTGVLEAAFLKLVS